MANHVYSYINFQNKDEEVEKELHKHIHLTLMESERTEMLENAHSVLEAFGFPEVPEENLNRGWYIDNIGAKWCTVEDFGEGYISTNSAWCAPLEFVQKCCELLCKIYPGTFASVEYEDEMPNFIGTALVTETEVDDIEEIDSEEICYGVKESVGKKDMDDEEFSALVWEDDEIREQWYEWIADWKEQSAGSQVGGHLEWLKEEEEIKIDNDVGC